MNRRSFFKSLALLTAGAAVAPQIFIPKFEPVKWKGARVFMGDLETLNMGLILQRNLEFLKAQLAQLDFVTDPQTGLSFLVSTYTDYSKRIEAVHGYVGATTRYINL